MLKLPHRDTVEPDVNCPRRWVGAGGEGQHRPVVGVVDAHGFRLRRQDVVAVRAGVGADVEAVPRANA